MSENNNNNNISEKESSNFSLEENENNNNANNTNYDNINENDINLNELFNFSVNFEHLKQAIGYLLQNQKNVNARLEALEEKIPLIDSVIETNNNLLSPKLNNKINNEIPILNENEEEEEEKVINKNEIINENKLISDKTDNNCINNKNEKQAEIDKEKEMDKEEDNSNNRTNTNFRQTKTSNLSNQDIKTNNNLNPNQTASLSNKEFKSSVFQNDNKFQYRARNSMMAPIIRKKGTSSNFSHINVTKIGFQNSGLDTSLINPKLRSIERQLDEIVMKNINYDKKSEEYDEKLNNLERLLENLKLKLSEIDIYDLFKNNSANCDIDAAKVMVQALEKKVFQKIGFGDEREKKLEVEMQKAKKEIINLKNFMQSNINQIKDDIIKQNESITSKSVDVNAQLGKLKTDLNTQNDKFSSSLKKVNNHLTSLNEENNKLDSDIKAIQKDVSKNYGSLSLSNRTINDNDFKSFQENIVQKLQDMDKQITELQDDYRCIQKLKDAYSEFKVYTKKLVDKATFEEFKNLAINLKDKSDEFGDILLPLSRDFNALKIQNESLCKKLQFINSQVATIQVQMQKNVKTKSNEGVETNIDLSGFMTIDLFQEFIKKSYNKEIEYTKKSINDLYILCNQNKLDLSNKLDDKDVKAFEEYIIGELEELKSTLSKRYLEKFDFNKQFKLLDLKVKNIIEILTKKSDEMSEPCQSQSWLIAKKPLNGYVCASCESYIGDLGTSADYSGIVNKGASSPQANKQLSDSVYNDMRMGSGFSRILNMLSVKDNINKDSKENGNNNNNEESDTKLNKIQNNNPNETKSMFNSSQNIIKKCNNLPKLNKNISNNTSLNFRNNNNEALMFNQRKKLLKKYNDSADLDSKGFHSEIFDKLNSGNNSNNQNNNNEDEEPKM